MIEFENLRKSNETFVSEYRKSFDDVLDTGRFILGNQVKEFENKFAAYCGTKFCAGVANGTDALTLALKAFSFDVGAEVIVPSNTYVATILSIINAGLKPVLVEPDIRTYNINPAGIEEVITEKTVAIMAVHLYGKCCAMDEIVRLAEKFNLKLIEDCAQAHGATFKGKKAGSFGDFGAFSFYPTKNLGALGDGGCLTTNDEDLKVKVELLRNYGSGIKYTSAIIGVNSRLDELQAAFLMVKLKSLDLINAHKRNLANIYSNELSGNFIKPVISDDHYDVFHIYAIRHPERNRLRDYLLKLDIQTEIHYPVPPHQQKALVNFFEGESFPISEEIHSTILSLPVSFMHSEKDILSVVSAMNKF